MPDQVIGPTGAINVNDYQGATEGYDNTLPGLTLPQIDSNTIHYPKCTILTAETTESTVDGFVWEATPYTGGSDTERPPPPPPPPPSPPPLFTHPHTPHDENGNPLACPEGVGKDYYGHVSNIPTGSDTNAQYDPADPSWMCTKNVIAQETAVRVNYYDDSDNLRNGLGSDAYVPRSDSGTYIYNVRYRDPSNDWVDGRGDPVYQTDENNNRVLAKGRPYQYGQGSRITYDHCTTMAEGVERPPECYWGTDIGKCDALTPFTSLNLVIINGLDLHRVGECYMMFDKEAGYDATTQTFYGQNVANARFFGTTLLINAGVRIERVGRIEDAPTEADVDQVTGELTGAFASSRRRLSESADATVTYDPPYTFGLYSEDEDETAGAWPTGDIVAVTAASVLGATTVGLSAYAVFLWYF